MISKPLVYYAVAKGRSPGIYTNYLEYQKQIYGFPGGKSKSFKTENEARSFLEENGCKVLPVSKKSEDVKNSEEVAKKYYVVTRGYNPGIYTDHKQATKEVYGFPNGCLRVFKGMKKAQEYYDKEKIVTPETNHSRKQIVAYVDGSFDEKYRCCGWGVVLLYNNKKYTYSGSKKLRKNEGCGSSIAELEAAKRAIKRITEIRPKPESALIHYDSTIVKDIMATDRVIKKKQTRMFTPYREFYDKMSKIVDIDFVKVPAHSGVMYNNEADRLARAAIGL